MTTFTETRAGERIPSPVTHRYSSFRFLANRPAGSMYGELMTIGRTNAADRQEIADGMAAITETAKLIRVAPNFWRIEFTVTHKIIPID